MKKTAILITALILSAPAYAQQNTALKAAAVVLPPVGLAAIGTSSTIHWTTVATQTWNFPWTYKPFNFGSVVGQGAHATGQYVHNVLNPHYFNETLHLTAPGNVLKPAAGQHTTTAQYKQAHSHTSKSPAGKIAVGCIAGSAAMTITAAIVKASRMGNPPRWRSQAEHEAIVASGYEKQFELTNDEAATAMAFCGLGGLYVMSRPVPQPVRTAAR